MKTIKQLFTFSVFSLISNLALANSDTISGLSLSENLEMTVGLEEVQGKNIAEQACSVQFIPGCGYSTLIISDERSKLAASFSMIENVDTDIDTHKESKNFFLNFVEGKGVISIYRSFDDSIGIQLHVNGKTKECRIK